MAPSVPLPGTLNPLGSGLAPGSREQLNLRALWRIPCSVNGLGQWPVAHWSWSQASWERSQRTSLISRVSRPLKSHPHASAEDLAGDPSLWPGGRVLPLMLVL